MTSRIILLLTMIGLGAMAARAETRIALIIGNGNYSAVSPLENPVNDAGLIGETLTDLGFQVTSLIDANQLQMKRAIAQFGRDLRSAGPDATGLFYYAGHGVQSTATNYLLPVDISVQDEADFDIMGVEANWVLRQMHSARNKTNIVILDACRNNPFESLADVLDDGLAEMNAPTGTFLSYATAPGGVAADGLGANSPFTETVARVIREPGIPIEQAFKQVRVAVLEATGGLQTPWDASSLTDNFAFVAETPVDPEDVAARQLWDSVKEMSDPVQVMLFLRAYPDSAYAEDARALLKNLMDEELNTPKSVETVEAPAPSGPSAEESALIEAAQASGAASDYEAYLDAFPNGAFADFARAEMDAARAKSAAATETVQSQGDAAAEEPVEMASRGTNGVGSEPITFEGTLQFGSPEIIGQSIAGLMTASPVFPPIEGLPDEVWKGKACSDCHQWERENLCEHGGRYLALSAQRSLGKEHPFGGSFKQTLRAWAAGGCN